MGAFVVRALRQRRGSEHHLTHSAIINGKQPVKNDRSKQVANESSYQPTDKRETADPVLRCSRDEPNEQTDSRPDRATEQEAQAVAPDL